MKQPKKIVINLARRELRHGWRHFGVFVLCMVLGVAVMATVGNLGAVVERALNNEAQSLLGGDAEIEIRGVEATDEQREFINSYGKTSYIATLRAMLQHDEQPTLVEIKSVDNAYPLMGRVELHENISQHDALKDHGAVVDSSLLTQLDLKIGDAIQIGEAKLTIRATIKREPDRAVHLFNFGPRVMIYHDSLKESGLTGTFSLVEHAYRIILPKPPIDTELFESQLEDALAAQFPETSWRVKTGTDGNRSIRRFLDQLVAFLTLSGLATFLIGGIGIGSSARVYLERKSGTIAVLKIMGALRHQVFKAYLLVLTVLALIGGALGVAISSAVTQSLMGFIHEWLPVTEGMPGFDPVSSLLAMWYGVLITYLFSMPALMGALNVRPALLFRSRSGVIHFSTEGNLIWGMVGLMALLVTTLMATANDKIFMAGAIVVLLVAFLLFWLCTKLVKKLARKIHPKRFWLKLALGNLHRPGATTGTVIFAIGISLTVLIALTLTEANFQARITSVVEEKAPNFFLIDIQPHQRETLESFLAERSGKDGLVMIYPMIRGRITHLKGESVIPENVDDDIRWAVRGDRGLSYGAAKPNNAEIFTGEWWPEDYDGKPLVSVDKRFLSGMNLSIGDSITLNILGEAIEVEVANARDIDYTTLQINFAMMLSPGVINHFPHTYISTVHAPLSKEAEAQMMRDMVKQFPGVTVIRTTEVVTLVREVMGHIATALRVTVAVSLLAGLLVLTSALNATIEQRLYDVAMLKVLGARQGDILKTCTAEWMSLALITSVIATAIGSFSAFLTLKRLRATEFMPMPEIIMMTVLGCMVVIWLTGYLGNRRIFRLRPAKLLRNE